MALAPEDVPTVRRPHMMGCSAVLFTIHSRLWEAAHSIKASYQLQCMCRRTHEVSSKALLHSLLAGSASSDLGFHRGWQPAREFRPEGASSALPALATQLTSAYTTAMSSEELATKRTALQAALGNRAGRLQPAQYDALIAAQFDTPEALLDATESDLKEVFKTALGAVRAVLAWQEGTKPDSVTSRPRAEPSIDRNRERVLSSLRALASRYQEVQLDRFLNGHEELLKLELNDVSPEVPPGLRTDVLFRDVYAGVLEIIRAGKHRGAVIFTGTPGVGKSSVAVVLACELASQRLRFLHRSTDVALGDIWVYMDFSKAGSFEVDYAEEKGDNEHLSRLRQHLRDPSVMLIWDGQMNRGQYHGERPYVVLSSPNEANFHDFRKGGVPVYHIDTWTLREILKACPLFPGVTQKMAVQRYQEHGGSVREVLANALVPGHTFHLLVEKAMSAHDLDRLCNLQFEGTSSNITHRLAHMRAGPDMLFSKLVIASPAVRQLAYRKMVELKKRTVRQMVVSGAAGERAHAGFRGKMLEEAGHEAVAGTGTVTVQPCKAPTRQEAINAARAAADKAATGAEAAVAAQAAAAMEQDSSMPPATAAIAQLRRSKRLRATASTTHAQEMQGMVRDVVAEMEAEVEEMEAELEDHHEMPPPEPPLEKEEAEVAEGHAQQQLAATLGSGEQQVQLTEVPILWDYPGLDIQGMSAYYLQPTSANNAGWDAVRKCPQHLWILQYTISEWHGIRAQAILDLLGRLSAADRERAILVFGVPDEVYPGYLKQPWLTVHKKRMQRVPAELQRMRQLVLKVPWRDADSRSSSDAGATPLR